MRIFNFRTATDATPRVPAEPEKPVTDSRLAEVPGEISKRLDRIDSTLQRLWRDIDFIRNRMSSYVGDGIALTYLADETPIFVNSNDWGCPANLIDGGRYEEENLEVLLSFVTPDTVFVDIGANIGFYTLQIARRLTGHGKAYAFEPHPRLAELLKRNVFMNGLSRTVDTFAFALSDRNATADLQYPIGHLGGGGVEVSDQPLTYALVNSEVKRLDDVLGPDFLCDLVKIDVEGHEIHVLEGMQEIVGNSPQIKILFEKLVPDVGTESALEQYFCGMGFVLYAINPDASLWELGIGDLRHRSGYVLAARPGVIEDGLARSKFSIYAKQLWPVSGSPPPSRLEGGGLCFAAAAGALLFYGPYWFLRRGRWRFKLYGEIRGAVTFLLLERFGYTVQQFTLENGGSEYVFTVARDLVYFECAARAEIDAAEIDVYRIELVREQ